MTAIAEAVELRNKVKSLRLGWFVSTEDIVTLIVGLSKVQIKGGGYLGIGSFHNLDIALDRGAEAIVLMDIDKDIVQLNKGILRVIGRTESFERILPNVKKFASRQLELKEDGFIGKYMGKGTDYGSRTPLNWTKDPEAFSRMKLLLSSSKIAVVCADITKPATMAVIGDFFSSCGTFLQYANISNVENPNSCAPSKSELDAMRNIPDSLYQAGGVPSTLVISSLDGTGRLPGSLHFRILKPISTLVPRRYGLRHMLRTLEDFTKEGPIIVPPIVGG